MVAKTAKPLQRPPKMGRDSRLGILLLKLYIPHVTRRTAYAGLWRIALEEPFSLVIHFSMEVCRISNFRCQKKQSLMGLGCGRFFEGKPEEMDTALNKTLAALPDDTKVYVRIQSLILSNGADRCSLAMNTQKPMLNLPSPYCKASLFRNCSTSQRTTNRPKANLRLAMRR
jgi:hypothetical protein